MILTPQQEKALQDLRTDLGEVVMATADYGWEEVKGMDTGTTFEHVLDWCKVLDFVLVVGTN